MPDGPLGNVLATVDVTSGKIQTAGDPSLRSVFGIATSLTDPLIVVQTAIPGSTDRYTLALAAAGADDFCSDALLGRRSGLLARRRLRGVFGPLEGPS
ncbi:MAG: hypothetical protein M5U19_19665 [Microthrixaceae bacterium]|nr:hypothetical protein [Microthrixaceae bacterium]